MMKFGFSNTRLIGLFFFLVLIQPVFGQIDKTFWFAVPEVSEMHGDRPISLRMTTYDFAASIKVSIPANPQFTPLVYTVGASQSLSVDLTDYIHLLEIRALDQITNQGLLIESDQYITVYYEVGGDGAANNPDIFALKGNNAIGLEFYTPFQTLSPNNANVDAWSSFDIVATENNTAVTITPSKDIVGHRAGISYTIILQRGQTYSARAIGVLPDDRPVGSRIVADKPIAVTVKDDSVYDFVRVSYDLIGDQLVPVSVLGTSYAAFGGWVYLLAVEDNTNVLVNGITYTLNRGDQQEVNLGVEAMYIESDLPIYVYHVIMIASDNSFSRGEFGGAILPPLLCTGSKRVSFVRSTFEDFWLTIYVKSGGEDGFLLNGSSGTVLGSYFEDISGSNGEWKYAKITLSDIVEVNAFSTIENTVDFHVAIEQGSIITGTRYGYFSDFGLLDLGTDREICTSEGVVLDAGFGKDSYIWSTGAETSFISVATTGVYWVEVTKGECVDRDTVMLTIHPTPEPFLDSLYEFCEGTNITISPGDNFISYSWNNAQTTAQITTDTAGMYEVEVSNEFECTAVASTIIEMKPLPKGNLATDTILCNDQQLTLQLFNSVGIENYTWSTGSNAREITVSEEGTYMLTASNECGEISDTINIGKWDVSLPNIFTPNGDNKNDYFVIQGMQDQQWRLDVYSRWGNIIYHNEAYDNSWSPEDVANGVYYYYLSQEAECNRFTGWVMIER